MTDYVFVGPTLGGDVPEAPEGIVFLPPAAQGDLYRVARERPRAIGIIDGYFDGVPSVWHKEILWAMSQGIHVYGAASMGALRAAELHPFGMRGVGRIFSAYRDGIFEDDDEVAVVHGPAETGYLALSVAMVNIRATLAAAAAAAIVGEDTETALVAAAKGLFYPDRHYDRLFDRGVELSLPAAELDSLRRWLPAGQIDRKREDALALVAEMTAFRAGDAAPMAVDFDLEWTEMWDDATTAAAASRRASPAGATEWVAEARILEELRLDADAFAAVRDRALLRALAASDAERRRRPADLSARRQALARLRARHRLMTRAELDRWLDANDLDETRVERLIEDEALLSRAAVRAAAEMSDHLLDELRLNGDYARLAERAGDKQALLTSLGFDHPSPDAAGIAPASLLAWYFERVLGRPLPDDLDDVLAELGLADRGEFYRALLRERLYCQHRKGGSEG